MRFLFPVLALALAAPAFGQNRPFIQPRPGVVGPMAVIPDQRTYYAFPVFYDDFPRQYPQQPVTSTMRYQTPVYVPLEPRDDPARGRITLTVPATAEVWIEGERTKSLGATREFLTPKLEEGRTYRYRVVVHWNEGNRAQERKLEVPVRAGETPAIMVLAPLNGK